MIIQNTNTNQGAAPARLVSDDAPKVVAQTAVHVSPQQPSAQQLKNAVDTINHTMQQSNKNLVFSIDSDTKKPIVKMVDSSTGELILQIPSEEAIAVSRSIDQFQKFQQGLLLKQNA